ncbi:hypothetical protein D3C83_151490 [compost metagenome]
MASRIDLKVARTSSNSRDFSLKCDNASSASTTRSANISSSAWSESSSESRPTGSVTLMTPMTRLSRRTGTDRKDLDS